MLDWRTILFIILALLGVGLFRRGWTGRRVDNHPWCRACRFDLRGRWPGAEKCPECGGVLEAVGAVEIGRRRRRPAALGLGLLLLLGCAVWIGVDVWKTAAPIDWTQYKPDWWVARDARSADTERAEAALKELNARIERDTINEARLAALVEYALELQADESAMWRTGWGDVVMHAWRRGLLDPEQRLRYLHQMGSFSLMFELESATFRQWEVTRAYPILNVVRGASEHQLDWQDELLSATLDGSPIPIDPQDVEVWGGCRVPVTVEPGERQVDTAWRLHFTPTGSGVGATTVEVPLSATLTVLPPPPDAPELIVDDDVTAALRACIEVQAVGLRLPPEVPGGWDAGPRIIVVLTLREVPIAGHLEIRAGVVPLSGVFGQGQTQLQAIRLSSYQARLFLQTPDGNEPGQVNIIIRPDASQTPGFGPARPGTEAIWYGKPIEINDIPVTWFDTADDPGLSEALRAVVMRPQGYDPLPGTFDPGTIQRGPSDKP